MITDTPIVTIGEPSPARIVEGDSLLIPCSAHSHPDITTVEWYNGDTLVDNPGSTLQDPSLRKDNIQREDRGNYKCRVGNEVGHTDSSEVTLEVLCKYKNVLIKIFILFCLTPIHH